MINTIHDVINNCIDNEKDLIIELNNGHRINLQYKPLKIAVIDNDILFCDDWIIPIKNITCMKIIENLEKQIKSVVNRI